MSKDATMDETLSDPRKSPIMSSQSTAEATGSTVPTMLSSQHQHSQDLATPPAEQRNLNTEECENDSVFVMTPSQPLLDRLNELEERWSVRLKSDVNHVHSPENERDRILYRPSRPRAETVLNPLAYGSESRTPARSTRKKLSVEIIGYPDQFRRRVPPRQSVFDRLYQQGNEQTGSRQLATGRGGRRFRSLPSPRTPQSSSMEGTISSMSNESVFDRLYKNEKRMKSPSFRISESDSISAASSLERRLAYAPPSVKRRNRLSASGHVAALREQRESRTVGSPQKPLSNMSRSLQAPFDERTDFSTDSVFERLYKGEKRKSPVLREKSVRTVKTGRERANALPTADSPKLSSDERQVASTDSVFERLYKREKRKMPLAAKTSRSGTASLGSGAKRNSGRRRRHTLSDTPTNGDNDVRHVEAPLARGTLSSVHDSDDSLLIDEFPEPTVLRYTSLSLSQEHDTPEGIPRNVDLAHFKLQIYARRIQRCGRAYIAGLAERERQARTIFPPFCSEEDRNYHAAVLIQRTWRASHSRLAMVASLLQSVRLTCVFDGAIDYGRILLVKLRLACLRKAMSYEGCVDSANVRFYDHGIAVAWDKQVNISFRSAGLAKMEIAVLMLMCDLPRLAFMEQWGSGRLLSTIIAAALLQTHKIDSQALIDSAVLSIQCWYRTTRKGRGRRLGVSTTHKQCCRSLYLSPTSLQRSSAVILQSAWRCHRSQILAAGALINLWSLQCDFNRDVINNRILILKIGVQSLSIAIGRVDYWWITENVHLEDGFAKVEWEREVHVTELGVPSSTSCTLCLTCECWCPSFAATWGRRKLAILLVKAILERALQRDRAILLNTSATLIQTCLRMKTQRIDFLSKRDAYSRTHKRSHETDFNQTDTIHPSDVSIDSITRYDLVFLHPESMEQASAIIQSNVRRFLVLREWQRLDNACQSIQCFIRRKRASRLCKSRKAAVTLIQRSMRSWHRLSTREDYRRNAVTTQSSWSAAAARESCFELWTSAIAIQTWERSRQSRARSFALRAEKSSDSRKMAALIVQRSFRIMQLRQQLTEQDKSATKIQCLYRRHHAVDKVHAAYAGIVALQAAHRGIQARRLINIWHRLVASARLALIVQAMWRGSRVRRQCDLIHSCARVIQSQYRMYFAMFSFQKLLLGTVAIQRLYRSFRSRRISLQPFAAVELQRFWRGSRARREVASYQDHLRMKAREERQGAVLLIQRWYQYWELRGDFLALREATMKIQACERRRRCIDLYKRLLRGFIECQALYRGRAARKIKCALRNSAELIQVVWRGSLIRKKFAIFRAGVISIQSAHRRRNSMVSFQKMVCAASKLQAAHRGIVTKQRVAKRTFAAILVQSAWRGRSSRLIAYALRDLAQRQRVQTITTGIVILQHITRKWAERSAIAATVVQRCFRKYAMRRRFLLLQDIAFRMQSLQRRRQRKKMGALARQSAVCLQARTRGIMTRRMLSLRTETENRSAVVIQRYYRGSVLRQNYLSLQLIAIQIQTIERRRQCATKYALVKRGAIRFQALHRGSIARRNLVVHAKMAVIIQRCWRCFARRRSFLSMRQVVIQLQASERRRLCVRKLSLARRGVTGLQARHRAVLIRKMLLMRVEANKAAGIIIQKAWTKYLRRQLDLARNLAAIRIQTMERRRICMANYAIVLFCITRLQARRRGFLTRQMLARTTEQGEAAAIIMRWYRRGFLQHRSLMVRSQAATRIQAVERRRRCVATYKLALFCISRVQARHRGLLTRQQISGRRDKEEAAVVIIQSQSRRLLCRQKCLAQRQAVVRIQAMGRRLQAQSKFAVIAAGILRLQTRHRRFLAKRILERRADMEESAVIIQSHSRSLVFRQKFQTEKQIAVGIQSAVRRWRVISKYAVVAAGVVRLQAQCRGLLIRRLLTELAAAVIMQNSFRRFASRREFLKLRNSAVRIQAFERARHRLTDYRRAQGGAIYLQARVRGCLKMRMYTSIVLAARRIQTQWRASLDHWAYFTARKSVVTIQMAFRRHFYLLAFQKIRLGIIALQAMRRGIVTRSRIADQYCAASKLQKYWRRQKIDRDPTYSAAATIQSRDRLFLAQRQYSKMDASARLIQVVYCTWKMQVTLLMVQSSVVLLQRSLRGQLLRTAARFALSHVNAAFHSTIFVSFTRITSAFDPGVGSIKRSWVSTVNLVRHAACVVIQSVVREFLSVRKYEQLKNRGRLPALQQFDTRTATSAFFSVESMPTSVSSITRVEAEIAATSSEARLPERTSWAPDRGETRQRSVQVIQRAFRSYLFRRSIHVRHIAACRLQAMYRRQRQMAKYALCRKGVVCLQKKFRGAHARLHVRAISVISAAILLQRNWRMHREYMRYNLVRQSVVSLQANYRTRCAVRAFAGQRSATLKIQASCRTRHQGQLARSQLTAMALAVITIQQLWRMHRESIRYKWIRTAALLIQARYRMRLASRTFAVYKKAAVVIQRAHRYYLHCELARLSLAAKTAAVVQIQRLWRAYRDYKHCILIQTAAVLIQAQNRMRFASRGYAAQRNAAASIQRAHRVRHKVMTTRLQASAVVRIQRQWRFQRDYLHFKATRAATVLIQTVCRKHVASRSFAVRKNSASAIQKAFRECVELKAARTILRGKMLAVVHLQSFWRMHCEKMQYRELRAAILLIQSGYRMFFASRSLTDQQRAAVLIQTSYRSCRRRESAIKLQAFVRRFLALRSLRSSYVGSIKIQRLWRGSSQRHKNVITKETIRNKALLLKGTEASIVLQANLISKQVCRRLLNGDGAVTSESTGICIGRLAHRVKRLSSKSKALRAFAVAKEKDQDRKFLQDTFATFASTGSGFDDPVRQASTIYGAPSLLAYGLVASHATNEFNVTDETKSAVATSMETTHSPSPNTLRLAMEAQELLQQARRARSDFLKSRNHTARPSTRLAASSSMTPRVAPTDDSKLGSLGNK